jgi:hypothetical protein
MPTDRHLQQLRASGAWWRLGSSALEPQLLAASARLDGFDPVEAELAGHGGVAARRLRADG